MIFGGKDKKVISFLVLYSTLAYICQISILMVNQGFFLEAVKSDF